MAVKETWKKWFRKDNLLILILSGVLLFIIAIPTGGDEEHKEADKNNVLTLQGSNTPQHNGDTVDIKESSSLDFASDLEKQLESILSEMSGVGRVKVMITLKTSEELVVEKDEPVTRSNTNESDSSGGNRSISQMDSGEATVYRTTGSDSEPYVVKTISPQVEGVVVVAQGAGSGTVNQNITEMVQALFGVEAHKVKVVKMESSK